MRKIHLLLFVFLISLSQLITAQDQHVIDSLLNRLQLATEDTLRVDLFINLSNKYINNSPEKALEYASRALGLAEEAGYLKGIVKANNNIGFIHRNTGDYDKALESYQKSLRIQEEIGGKREISACLTSLGTIYNLKFNYEKALIIYQEVLENYKELGDKIGIAGSLNNIGTVYNNMNDFDKAMEHYHKSIQIKEELGDKISVSSNFNNIGIIHYHKGNYDEALEYYQKSLEITEEIGNKKSIGIILNNIGLVYSIKSNYDKALECYQKVLIIVNELGDKRGVSRCLNDIGVVYEKMGDFDKSLEYYQESLRIFTELNDKIGIATCITNFGNVHYYQKNYITALTYYQKSLKIVEEIGFKKEISNRLNDISNINIIQGNFTDAYNTLNKAIAISNEIDNKNAIAKSTFLLGELFLRQNQYSDAKEQYDKALILHTDLGENKSIAEDYIKICEINFLTGNVSEAIENGLKGYEIAKEIGAKDLVKQASEWLSESYAKQGSFEQAYNFHVLFKEINDSLFSIESQKKIAAIESQFEVERKEQEIALQKAELDKKDIALAQQQTQRNALIGGSAALFVLSVLIIYLIRANQQKKEHRLQEALYMNMQQTLSQQMNPHFIFNTLNSIQSFIHKNKPEESMVYLSEFGSLMRKVLNSSQHYLISLNDEIEILKTYSKLESLRFNNGFALSVEVNGTIDTATSKIPVFLLQPLVENAIRHGLEPKTGKGSITLKINKNEEGLICRIEDKGAGQINGKKSMQKEGHTSVATGLIKKRLNILSMYYKKEFKFQLAEMKSETGDIIGSVSEISLPLLN